MVLETCGAVAIKSASGPGVVGVRDKEFMPEVLRIVAGIIVFWIIIGVINDSAKKKEEAERYDPPQNFDSRWASREEVEAAGAFKKQAGGVPVGWWVTKGWFRTKRRTIWFNPKPGQLKGKVVYGSMGAGKTSGFHTPEQRHWPYSYCDFTATAESAISMAKIRQQFGPVWLINPNGEFVKYFPGIPETRINPCAAYRLDPGKLLTFGTRAAQLTRGAIPEQDARDKFWDNSSRGWAKVVMMALAELNRGGATITEVARVFHGDPVHFSRWASERTKIPEIRDSLSRYVNLLGDDFAKSIEEVRQNTCAHLAPFLAPGVARSLSRADLQLGSLRLRPQTLIVVNSLEHIGAEESDRFRTFVLEALLAEIQSEQFSHGRTPVAVGIDELIQYPRMPSVLRAQSSLRKYNAYISSAVNDYSSLARIYSEEGCQSFMNNAGLTTFLAPIRDDKGVRFLHRALGEHDFVTFTKSWNNPFPGHTGHSTVNLNATQQRRPLLTEEEIRRLPPGTQIMWMDGVARPIFCQVRPYYLTSDVNGTRPNIYHRG